ncbi:MAG TPA: MFS transporter, partial [Lautropia sp.]|nr:MFS transporter [Lautropia sp.]
SQGSSGWPETWFAMGIVAWLMLAITYWAARQIDEPMSAQGSADWALRPLLPAFIAYIGFGLGYIVYMTFIIAWLKAIGASSLQMSVVWSVLGLSTLLAPLVWSKPIATWPNGRAMAAILLVLALGALLPVIPFEPAWQPFAMQCSAALFGLGMFSAPSSISALIKRTQQKQAWGSAMATFTIAFAASQIVAPVASGILADWSGSLRSGLALSGLMILVSASIAWLQKDLKQG